jgi:hypothetical protein
MAAPYFFFGTLMDAELLARVAGEPVAPGQIVPAEIAGFRRTGVIARSYPILMERPGGRVAGVLVFGLSPRAGTRLDAYEGANYELKPVTVRAGRWWVAARYYAFVGMKNGLRSDGRLWVLERWRRRWKRRAMRRAGRLGRATRAV